MLFENSQTKIVICAERRSFCLKNKKEWQKRHSSVTHIRVNEGGDAHPKKYGFLDADPWTYPRESF